MVLKALCAPVKRGLTKTLRIMKITAIILLSACLTASANGHSQQVTLKVTDAPLKEVFKEIKRQTGFTFAYNESLLSNTKNVTIRLENASLDRALDACFTGQPLSYEIIDRIIVVKEKPNEPKVLLPPINELPPPITVKGRVVNENGEGVVASVVVKGTSNGATTDASGYFTLNNVDENATLVITGVSVETIEVKVNGKGDVGEIATVTKIGIGQEVIIKNAGYYNVKDKEETGNISKINAKTISQQPVSNVLAALEGRVPGMFITQNTGMPGGSFTVQIRGKNSIANGTDPLYIIDGVPYTSQMLGNVNPASGGVAIAGNPLNFINPSDIESVSVLKDADATAIYGSRAANGAVLITTKKGVTGKMKWDVNVYTGTGVAPTRMDWLNTSQYLQMRHKAFNDDGIIPSTFDAPDLLVWDTARYTDWKKLIIGGTAHYTDAQTNFSGGTQNLQYLFGVGYHKESTVFPFDGADQKVSAHFSIINISFDKKFKLILTGNFLQDNSNLPSTDLTAFVNTSPVAPPIYNSDGSLNWASSTWFNPMSLTLQKYKAHTSNLVSNAVLSYQLFKNLEIKTSLGYTNMQVNEIKTTPISSQDPAYAPSGYSAFTNNSIFSWIIEPQADYKINCGQHHIEALLGSTFQSNKNNGQIIYGSGYASDAMLENIQAAPTLSIASVTNVNYKYNAIFGRLHYDYRNKLLLNLTMRRDGSSRFGANSQFNNFGSVGTAWIFSKESFMKNIKFLSFGKVRASYGTTGNDQIGDYRFHNLFGSTSVSYQGTTGLIPLRLPNQNLAWEETKKAEIGLDLGFVNDRFLIGASYYLNRSSNQLLVYPLPALAGFTTITANLRAKVQNHGFEFSITTINVTSENFKWTSFINLTIGRNKLISYPNLSNSAYKNLFIIGQPITIKRVYHLIGINDTTGLFQFSNFKGDPTYSPSFPNDAISTVNTAPKYYGAFENTLQYKRIALDFMFQFRKQIGINHLVQAGPPGFGSNYPSGIMNGLSQKFTQTYGQVYNAYTYAQQSDFYYTDASYIRLSNVSISYMLPDKWSRKLRLSNCRIYMQGQNLLTLTSYKGMDPENQSLTVLPPLKVVTAGIQLSL